MDVQTKRWQLTELPLELIRVDETQPRIDFPEAERKELTASLTAHGQQEPITVYPQGDGYVVVSGARRRISAEDAGLKKLLAVVLDRQPEPGELYLHQLLANAHRLDLNPLELCAAYQKLMQLLGINATELARTVSKSKTYVSNVLSLDRLPPPIQQLIRERRLGLAKAALIARLPQEEQSKLAAESLNRAQLERKTARKKSTGQPVRRVTLELPRATVSMAGRVKLSVDDLIDVLQSLVKECKRARAQGLDVSTLASILRDRATLPSAGGA